MPIIMLNGASVKITPSAISVLQNGIVKKTYSPSNTSEKEIVRLVCHIVTRFPEFRGQEGGLLETMAPRVYEIYKSIRSTDKPPNIRPVEDELFIGVGHRAITFVTAGPMHMLITMNGAYFYPAPYQFKGNISIALLCLRAGWYFEDTSPWYVTVREGTTIISDYDSLLNMEETK